MPSEKNSISQPEAELDGVKGSVHIPAIVFVPSETAGDTFLDFRLGAVTSPGADPMAANIAIHGWAINRSASDESSIVNSQWLINSVGIRSELQYRGKLVVDFMVKEASR